MLGLTKVYLFYFLLFSIFSTKFKKKMYYWTSHSRTKNKRMKSDSEMPENALINGLSEKFLEH